MARRTKADNRPRKKPTKQRKKSAPTKRRSAPKNPPRRSKAARSTVYRADMRCGGFYTGHQGFKSVRSKVFVGHEEAFRDAKIKIARAAKRAASAM